VRPRSTEVPSRIVGDVNVNLFVGQLDGGSAIQYWDFYAKPFNYFSDGFINGARQYGRAWELFERAEQTLSLMLDHIVNGGIFREEIRITRSSCS